MRDLAVAGATTASSSNRNPQIPPAVFAAIPLHGRSQPGAGQVSYRLHDCLLKLV